MKKNLLSKMNENARQGRRCAHASARNERGAAVVEFALSCTALVAVLVGFLQVCLAIYESDVVSNMARDGARWAIVRGSTSCTNTPNLTGCNATEAQIKSYMLGLNYPGISANDLNIKVNWMTASAAPPVTWTACSSGKCNAPGNAVQVVVSCNLPLNIPFVPANTFNLNSSSQMVISQ